MFSFRSRKQHVDVSGYLRRICDCTTPNNGLNEHCERTENRYNRTLPVLVWPWTSDQPAPQQCVTAVTKDVTDHGMALILTSPLTTAEIVVGILSDETATAAPWFFRGEIVRGKSIGADYWLYGTRLSEFLNKDRPDVLDPLLAQTELLRPIAKAEFCTRSK